MSKNLVKDHGRYHELTAPTGGVVSGQGYSIGSLFVVAMVDAAQTLPFVGDSMGVYSLTKNATDTFSEGAEVYWDDSAKECIDASASGAQLIGVAVGGEFTGVAGSLEVKLDGVAAIPAP